MSGPAREVEPRHHTKRNPDRRTLGGRVAKIALAKGRPLQPWQRRAADVALELDEHGLPFYRKVLVSAQRRSGKTDLAAPVAEERCISREFQRVWFTQQTGKYAGEWFRDEYLPRLERTPLFAGRYKVGQRAGSETVTWWNGSFFRMFPPQKDALHSKDVDQVFVDEAWVHDAVRGHELGQALTPAKLTRPGSQTWLMSAAGTDESAYWNAELEAGIASLDDPATRTCVIDYGIEDDDDPEDLERIAERHPAFGILFGMDSLVAAREEFRVSPSGDDVAGWTRAYGNLGTRTRHSSFGPGVWDRLGRAHPSLPRRAGVAFDVTPSGEWGALAAAWRDVDGRAWLEVLHSGPDPSTWLAAMAIAKARAMRSPIGYDTSSVETLAIADQITRLNRAIEHAPLTTGQFATACSVIYGAAIRDRLRHSRQPHLDAAVERAGRSPVLDGGWKYSRKSSSGSIAELVAGTVALRTFDDLPAPTDHRIIG